MSDGKGQHRHHHGHPDPDAYHWHLHDDHTPPNHIRPLQFKDPVHSLSLDTGVVTVVDMDNWQPTAFVHGEIEWRQAQRNGT